jgi:hypothetical protein
MVDVPVTKSCQMYVTLKMAANRAEWLQMDTPSNYNSGPALMRENCQGIVAVFANGVNADKFNSAVGTLWVDYHVDL